MKIKTFKITELLYFLISVILLIVCLYFSYYKYKFHKVSYIVLVISQVWLFWVGLKDLQLKQIKLFLTAPILFLTLILGFIFPFSNNELSLIGIESNAFKTALGITFGFLLTDLLTHFGNWIMKFPKSSQGLLAIWCGIPICIFSLFFSEFSLWINFLIICIFSSFIYVIYNKYNKIKIIIEKLIKNSLLTYICLFILFLGFGYCSINYPLLFSNTAQTSIHIVFSLCFSYLFHEVLIPIFLYLKNLKTNKNIQEQEKQQEEPSVLGGGDAYLNACVGAIWSATALNTFLLLAIFLVFIYAGFIKLYKFLKKQNSSQSIEEIAFAPFVSISIQILTVLALIL